jgi:hypothetical protein
MDLSLTAKARLPSRNPCSDAREPMENISVSAIPVIASTMIASSTENPPTLVDAAFVDRVAVKSKYLHNAEPPQSEVHERPSLPLRRQ